MLENINNATTFEQIVEIRQQGHLENHRNDNNLERVLVSIYKEYTHFLFELLQNADDSKATDIAIRLEEKKLIFWHNGSKNFDLRDVIAITGVGAGTKNNEINKIGKFGIGFKSVFSITDSPQIFSKDYCFKIKHFLVPQKISRDKEVNPEGTTFVLPLKNKEKSVFGIYSEVKEALHKLNSNAFMFLNNIINIDIDIPNVNYKNCLIKKIMPADDNSYHRLTVFNKEHEVLEDFIVFSRPLSFNSNLKISIAYGIQEKDGKLSIIPLNNRNLSVYFFTEMVTNLKFIIDGPFQTSSTRESVDESSNHNKKVLKEISGLYRQSVRTLKKEGYLDEQLIEILPINKNFADTNFVYSSLYTESKILFSKEPLLPTNIMNAYSKSEDALLALDHKIINLVYQSKDLL
jgi:hypothetical protein